MLDGESAIGSECLDGEGVAGLMVNSHILHCFDGVLTNGHGTILKSFDIREFLCCINWSFASSLSYNCCKFYGGCSNYLITGARLPAN